MNRFIIVEKKDLCKSFTVMRTNLFHCCSQLSKEDGIGSSHTRVQFLLDHKTNLLQQLGAREPSRMKTVHCRLAGTFKEGQPRRSRFWN